MAEDFEAHRRAIDAAKKIGVRQVRDEIFFHLVEPKKDTLTFPEHCWKNVMFSYQQGIDTLIILDYGNLLYEEGQAPSQPETRRAFARYAAFLAEKLKGKVKYFEVWNEPNVDGFWRPHSNPRDYFLLLKETYLAVKKANPQAIVVAPATAGSGEDFFPELLELGGYPFFDVASFHPYCHPRAPEPAGIFEKMAAHRERMADYGTPKPIWLTEIGYPTNLDGGISELNQARYLARIYLISMTVPWLETVFWYWLGPDGPDASWAEHRFGLFHQDFSDKPSALAYETLSTLFSEATFSRALSRQPDNYRCYEFRKKSDYLYALWLIEGEREFAITTTQPIQLSLFTGTRKTLQPLEGKVFCHLSPSPLYFLSPSPLMVTPSSAPLQMTYENTPHILPREQKQTFTVVPQPNLTDVQLEPLGTPPDGITLKRKDTHSFELQTSSKAKPGEMELSWLLKKEEKPFAFLATSIEITDPLRVKVSPILTPDQQKSICIDVTNTSLMPLTGNLTLDLLPRGIEKPSVREKARFSLPFSNLKPSQSLALCFPVATTTLPDQVFTARWRVEMKHILSLSGEEVLSFYPCFKSPKPLTIDGDLSDWPPFLPPIRINQKWQRSGGYQPWDGTKDSEVWTYTAWDEKWFYLAIEFADDQLSSPCTGHAIYNNDGVELYLDTEHDADFFDTRHSDDDFQFGLFPARGEPTVWLWSRLNHKSPGSVIHITGSGNRDFSSAHTISSRTFKGMLIEAAIPFEELTLEPYPGLHIGCNLAFTDNDDPKDLNPFMQQLQMSWSGRKNSWQNPQAFVDLFFVSTPENP